MAKSTQRRALKSKNARKAVASKVSTTKFRVVTKENPRYEGTRAQKAYAAMLRFASKRGGVFTIEQLKAAKIDYTPIDARWDLEHGNLKKAS